MYHVTHQWLNNNKRQETLSTHTLSISLRHTDKHTCSNWSAVPLTAAAPQPLKQKKGWETLESGRDVKSAFSGSSSKKQHRVPVCVDVNVLKKVWAGLLSDWSHSGGSLTNQSCTPLFYCGTAAFIIIYSKSHSNSPDQSPFSSQASHITYHCPCYWDKIMV